MDTLERIQILCKKSGITLSKLETEVGFGRGTLYKWNKSSPNTDKLTKIADYFDVSLDYLVGRTDDPKISIKKAPPENGATEYAIQKDVPELTVEEIQELRKFLKNNGHL